MKTIKRIQHKTNTLKRLRVAAYARVSMECDKLKRSLSEQISFYSNLIQNTPQWTFAGIYSDDGISGTGMNKRSGFLKMIEDCDNGQIDIILTKSIQRFARNTVDLLKTVRHLKDIGVEVRFERENINTFSQEGELMLSILASFAQEESRSISENLKWAIRKKNENGLPHCKFNIYGYKWENDNLIPIPDEADAIKQVFDMYLCGMTVIDVSRKLNDTGLRYRNGKLWDEACVRRILNNRIYTGELLLQKYCSPDIFPRKRIKNNGDYPMYLVHNSHEAIVDLEKWEDAQAEILRRRDVGTSWHVSTFSGKIICGQCGHRYHRKKKYGTSVECWFWTCTGKESHQICSSIDFKEDVMKAACATILKTKSFDEDLFSKEIHHITVINEELLKFTFFDGNEVEIQWKLTNRKRRLSLPFPTMVCGTCGNDYRIQRYRQASGRMVEYYRCYKCIEHGAYPVDEISELLKGIDFSFSYGITMYNDFLSLDLRDGNKEIIHRRKADA